MTSPQEPEFNALDDIGTIRVNDIDLGERLRPVDENHAAILGAAMKRDGQLTPIVICRMPGEYRWLLVAGAHRLIGAKLAEISHLKAQIIASSELSRRRHEIGENLLRKGLSPIERATFVAELVNLHKMRIGIQPCSAGRRQSALARWQKALKAEAGDATATIAVAYGWAESVAEQTGFSERTIYNDLLLYSRLTPSVARELASHPILSNSVQLRALAKLDSVEQKEVVRRLVDGAKSVSEARATIDQRVKPDAESRRLSAFIGSYSRMGIAEKKAALRALGDLLPKGWLITDEQCEIQNTGPSQ